MEAASRDLAFEYRITETDFVHAFLTHYRNCSRVRAVLYYAYPILGVILVFLAVFLAVMQTRAGEEWTGPVPLFIVGAVWLGCYFGRPFWLKRLYRKDQRYKTPVRVRIIGDEVYVTTATAEGHYRPGSYVRALETDELILLYHSPIMFSFVPKRDLSPEQRSALSDFLDRELPLRKGPNRLPAIAPAS
jgi:hypothetical protein